MKTTAFASILALASALAIGSAAAQPVPFNEAGVTMGHWHIISKDVEENKKIFLAMGGKLFMPGGAPLMMFPGVYINLTLGNETGDGGTRGSVVNHVGFIVNNVQERVAQWKAGGLSVLPGNNNRLDQAYVETPDGVRIEILEDKTQAMPIRHEHVHFFLPEAEIPKAVAWYAKTFDSSQESHHGQHRHLYHGCLGHPDRDHPARAVAAVAIGVRSGLTRMVRRRQPGDASTGRLS
jgi:catechol 2,3-dioxygenase-like lactoylglutathione lyase family enzyme